MPRRSSEFLVLAIDLGSSSTRTALFDDSGRCLRDATAHRQYSVRYTTDGGAELGMMTLRHAAAACLKETLSVYRRRPSAEKRIPIRALTGCAFWHSLLALDRKRQPITPIFTWADSRSMADARLLRRELSERETHARTGCMLRASFWPAKLRWLRRTQPALFRRAAHWVSPAQWIFSELFHVHACSHSMASATGMYDLRLRTWDLALCHACGISPEQLGMISDECETNALFPRQLRHAKIFTAIGDGAASNIGSGTDRPGFVAINLGTSAAVRMIQRNDQAGAGELPFGLFRYVVDEHRTVLGGATSNAGNLHRWCLRELRLNARALEKQLFSFRDTAAYDELVVLPFWVQERAPTWPEDLRGTVVGLSQTTTAAEILRAATTATFYRLRDILELFETSTGDALRVIVSGGAANSSATLRLLADCLGRDIEKSAELEASLSGAAIYALERLGAKPARRRRGRFVRHIPALSAKHQERRTRQVELEELLSSDLPLARRLFRRAD